MNVCELLGLTPIELNKVNKKIEKINSFLKEKFPLLMENINHPDCFCFFDVISELHYEFAFGDKKNVNYKYFPWKEEIRKRLHEKYGFKLLS